MRKRMRRVVGFVAAGLILASCTSNGSTSPDGLRDASVATLTVHIGLFGGPARPNGGMALSNSPAENENVTAVDAAGHKSIVRTNADGVATMSLTPGRYTVFSTYCGTGRHHVLLTAEHAVRVLIDCPVP